MKKLIIAAAIVCAGAMSQAATFAWTTNGKMTDAKGNVIESTTALNTFLGDNAAIVLVKLATATDWANAKVVAEGTSGNNATVKTSPSAQKGKLTKTYTFVYDEVNTAANALNNGDIISIMFKDAKGNLSQLEYADGTLFSETTTIAGLVNDQSTATAWATAGAAKNFTTQSVPEPTSGLLLVLGMAGLALRRRRA